MNKYKLVVSKGQKRHTVILTASDEKSARERVHNEGYSILSAEQITDEAVLGHKFVFSAMKDGEVKTGKVVGNDIFKVYVKLKRDLGYDVDLLYAENDEALPYDEKKKIVKDLKGEYAIYKGTLKEKKEKKSKEEMQKLYLQKELNATYRLIELVLEKLETLLNGQDVVHLSSEKMQKLKNLYNSIVKIKKSTNIAKLKEIGELALIKIGSLELEEVEKHKSQKTKKLLKETNKLLKEIGSKEQFIEKEKDVKYILSTWKQGIEDWIENIHPKNKKKAKVVVDKSSHSYIKTELLLRKYQEKLTLNTKELFKNFGKLFISLFKKEESIDDLFMRRRVIKQNIALFKAKQKGVGFSYTSIVKGYKKLLDALNIVAQAINVYLYLIIVIYTILFIAYININYYNPIDLFNYNGIYYFLILLCIHIILKLHLGFFTVAFGVVFLSFITIFGIVNF